MLRSALPLITLDDTGYGCRMDLMVASPVNQACRP